MMLLNTKTLILIILNNASIVRFYNETGVDLYKLHEFAHLPSKTDVYIHCLLQRNIV